MEKSRINVFEMSGSNYEIGYNLGKTILNYPQMLKMQISEANEFNDEIIKDMIEMFDKYCPGLNEELKGFADAIEVNHLQVVYYTMTYLTPGCSLLAILPKLMENNHVMVARNYEFSHKMEDFVFCKTKVKGKYAHMGGSVMQFGRSEGINECGLMVGQTSCGLPVGNMEMLRKPKVKGLQFWAVIRSILENCRNVDEALSVLKEMPIAYNINLIVADNLGNAALFETLDGKKAVKKIDNTTKEQYIHSTNHAHLAEIIELEPLAMEHSVCRYEFIKNYMNKDEVLSDNDLKKLLLSKYPLGLCCHWYDEFFGTIKSMVFDVTLKTVDICWGGDEQNGWKKYSLDDKMNMEMLTANINIEHPTFDFAKLVKI